MRQDFNAFHSTKRLLSKINDRCSEILFDPEASEERKAAALEFRRSLHVQYDASDGAHCGRVRDDAVERARVFLGEPNFGGY